MAENDIAKLGIAIDASEVTPAASKLDGLTAAGAKAEVQTDRVTVSAKQLATALAATGNDLAKATALLDAQATAATATATATARAAVVTVESAVAMNGAAVTMAQSFNALGSSAVRAAAEIGASAEASAAAEVAAAGATVAAHGAVGVSSRALTESLVLVREAARGNFTRMAGSASILIQALGLLNVVLIPLVATAAVLGSVFAIATNQINSGAQGTGDLTKNLGLTADQLDKVSNHFVSMKDTALATFQVLGRDIYGALGGDKLASAWQDTWNFIAKVATDILTGLVGSVVGTVRVIEEAWKAMPVALGGEGTIAGIDFAKAFQSGIDDTKKSLDKFYADVGAQARKNALDRILDEAGKNKTPRDGALSSVETQIQKLNDETKAQNALNEAVSSTTMTVEKALIAQKLYEQVGQSVAKLERDKALTEAQRKTLIGELTSAQQARNAVEIEWNAILDAYKAGDQLQYLQKEIDLIGASDRARVISLATLKAEQEARLKLYNASQTADFVQGQVDIAKAQYDLQSATKAANSELSLQKDLYAELDSAAQAAASHMGDSFGNVGKAFASMTTALTSYAAKQSDFAAQQEKLDKQGNTDRAAQILLDQKRADASTEYYASEIDGLKSMFGKKTAIYAALNAAEQIYNSIQLVNSLARVSASVFETTAKVTGVAATSAAQVTGAAVETGTTAVSVANAGVQASAWGVTAIAKAIASLPFPFDLLAGAAVAAALIGFGVAVFGGGGSGASAADIAANDPANSKNVQTKQGAGSILGDAAAKSDSIQKSLDNLTKNTNADLDYSNQMVFSLRSIDAHISSLTSLLAQQLQVGGAFDSSGLKLGTNSSGGLLSSLFGSTKTTNTLLDQGIQVQATTVGKAIADGITANSYQTVQTTKQSSALFGLISSTKTSNATTTSALGSDFTDQISAIIGGLRSTVLQAATKLGIEGAQSVVDSLAVNIGKISLNGLTGSQIQDALNAVFGQLGDDLASAVIPQLKSFQQVGEGTFATLTRLVSEYQAVDDVQKTIGFTFSKVGLDGIAARDSLIQLAGGLGNFQSQASAFAQNFLTNGQQLAPVAQAVAAAMGSLGFAGVATKAQFVSLVQGLDLSTDSGAALYTQLMSIAPAFAKVADAATALADQQRDMEIKLLQDQGDAIGATALQREKELAALDDSLKPLQEAIYAQEDLNAAQADATQASTDLANATNAAATAQNNVVSAQKAVSAANDKVSAAQVALNNLLNPQVNTVQALSNAHNRLASAYSAESTALQATISQFGGFASSLKSFSATLSGSASSDPLSVYATARIAFQQLNALPANDATRLANLQNVGANFISASQAASATSQQYQADVSAVRSAVDQSANAAQATADSATQQLNALNDSVAGLGILNESVLSVKDAIQALNDAQIADNAYQSQVKDAELSKAKSDLADAQQAQADALTALAGKIASLDAANQQTAVYSKKVADLLLRVTQNGDYLLTKVAA